MKPTLRVHCATYFRREVMFTITTSRMFIPLNKDSWKHLVACFHKQNCSRRCPVTNRCAAAYYARKIKFRYSETLRVLVSKYFMNIIIEILEKLIFKIYFHLVSLALKSRTTNSCVIEVERAEKRER